MAQHIDKDVLAAEIERLKSDENFKRHLSQEDGDHESYVAWTEHIAACETSLAIEAPDGMYNLKQTIDMDRNEAIQVVKDNWPENRHQLKEALQTLIPELQESKDERIRRFISNELACLRAIDEKVLIDMKN